jgi:hypothetical protein
MGTNDAVIALGWETTPSMKADVYPLLLVFTPTGSLILSASSCGCPDGQFCCSHLIGAFGVFRAVQQTKSSLPELIALLPEPVRSVQARPINLEHFTEVERQDRLLLAAEAKAAAGAAVGGQRGGEGASSDSEEQEHQDTALRVRALSALGNQLAASHPGYTAVERSGNPGGDAEIEARADRGNSHGKKACICAVADEFVSAAAARVEGAGGCAAATRKYAISRIDTASAASVARAVTAEQELDMHEAHHTISCLMQEGALRKNLLHTHVAFPAHAAQRQGALTQAGRGCVEDGAYAAVLARIARARGFRQPIWV